MRTTDHLDKIAAELRRRAAELKRGPRLGAKPVHPVRRGITKRKK
jgi:hypothetical protein